MAMTDEAKQIVKALRSYGLHGRDSRCDTELKAARLITDLFVELDGEHLVGNLIKDTLEAANRDIFKLATKNYVYECEYCTHRGVQSPDRCSDCGVLEKSHFEWRGLCKENEGVNNGKTD